MKIRELFESLVNEQARADLYHGTSLRGAVAILKSNLIKANMELHSTVVPATVKGHSTSVSLTRSFDVARKFAWDKMYNWRDITGVIFVLDQDLLKRDFGKRLRPYDDTDTEWFAQQLRRYDNEKGPASWRSLNKNEIEEIVYGDIPNASKYIKQIVVFPPGGDNAEKKLEMIKQTGILDDPRAVLSYKVK
jgi:hypothetical protein